MLSEKVNVTELSPLTGEELVPRPSEVIETFAPETELKVALTFVFSLEELLEAIVLLLEVLLVGALFVNWLSPLLVELFAAVLALIVGLMLVLLRAELSVDP